MRTQKGASHFHKQYENEKIICSFENFRKFINSSNPIVCQYTYYTPKVNFKRQAGGKTPLYSLLFYIFLRENDHKSSVTHPFLKVLLTEN